MSHVDEKREEFAQKIDFLVSKAQHQILWKDEGYKETIKELEAYAKS